MSLEESDLMDNKKLSFYKSVISDFFSQFKIRRVAVFYSGSGDSGDIDSVEIEMNDGKTYTFSSFSGPIDGNKEIMEMLKAFPVFLLDQRGDYSDFIQFISDFSLVALENKFPGWEINDGSSGSLVFKKGKKAHELTIVIEHTEYYTESSYQELEL